MAYKLREDPTIKYNDTDRRMFAVISEQPKSTIELLEKYYEGRERPFSFRETAIGILRILARKIDTNREPFQLISSKRNGSIPIEWHLAPRILTPRNRSSYMRARLKAIKAKVEAA